MADLVLSEPTEEQITDALFHRINGGPIRAERIDHQSFKIWIGDDTFVVRVHKDGNIWQPIVESPPFGRDAHPDVREHST